MDKITDKLKTVLVMAFISVCLLLAAGAKSPAQTAEETKEKQEKKSEATTVKAISWEKDFQRALSRARDKNMPILLDFFNPH